jgi:hypothetical protein
MDAGHRALAFGLWCRERPPDTSRCRTAQSQKFLEGIASSWMIWMAGVRSGGGERTTEAAAVLPSLPDQAKKIEYQNPENGVFSKGAALVTWARRPRIPGQIATHGKARQRLHHSINQGDRGTEHLCILTKCSRSKT